MGTVRKRGKTWRAEVVKKGLRKSATFDTKAQAWSWVEETELAIDSGRGRFIVPSNATFRTLMQRYINEVSPSKKGNKWERDRVNAKIGSDDDPPDSHKRIDPIAHVPLATMCGGDVADWRNRRLKEGVAPSTVLREWTLFSAACAVAKQEWHWLKENPFSAAKRPPAPRSRDRLATDDEIERMLFALGYDSDKPPKTVSSLVGAAAVLAIETGMRAGEICALRWGDIDIRESVARVIEGKTQAASRDVALSSRAVALLTQLRGDTEPKSGDPCFGIKPGQIDALWRKNRGRAVVNGLRFHDLRHLAVTRLAKKIGLLDLARMIGHKNIRTLQIYYNERASAIAKLLD